MTPENSSEWPENLLCARCDAVLGEDFSKNSLGLRFCPKCFAGTIKEKKRERDAEIYLKGSCSECGGSLINGYHMSELGVICCLSCRTRPPEKSAPEPSGEDPEPKG